MTADKRYREILQETLDRAFDENATALESAADAIEKRLARGGMWYAFGTGHGHLLALELFYRAGGPVRVYPILEEKLMLHVGAAESSELERETDYAKRLIEKLPVGSEDIVLIASNSGRNNAPVEMALEAKARGALVIALTSRTHSESVTPRTLCGKRLFEVADIVLDNCGRPGDAAVQASDGGYSGATSTAIGAALLQAIVARVRELALERGDQVDFFMSANLDGGDEHNHSLVLAARREIPFL